MVVFVAVVFVEVGKQSFFKYGVDVPSKKHRTYVHVCGCFHVQTFLESLYFVRVCCWVQPQRWHHCAAVHGR